MKVTIDELKKLSADSKLNVSAKDLSFIHENFSPIIDKLDKFQNLNLEKIEPLNMIYESEIEFESTLREDSSPEALNKKDVLKNAKNKNEDYFLVKR